MVSESNVDSLGVELYRPGGSKPRMTLLRGGAGVGQLALDGIQRTTDFRAVALACAGRG